MNERQRRFVAEYLIDLNATQAAIRAGYSEKTARSQGQRMLTDVDIAAAIAEAQGKREKRTSITQDRVLRELAAVAFSDIGDVLDFSGSAVHIRYGNTISSRARRAIAGIKVKRYPERVGTDDDGKPIWEQVEIVEFKLWDKNTALANVAKHLGMMTDRVELTGKDGAPLMPMEAAREAVEIAEKRGLTLVKDDGKRRAG